MGTQDEVSPASYDLSSTADQVGSLINDSILQRLKEQLRPGCFLCTFDSLYEEDD